MKRDMDIVREILFALEEAPDANLFRVSVEGRSQTEVGAHLLIMEEAGLVRLPNNARTLSSANVLAALTWDGHEFLDKVREDTLWAKAKSYALQTTGGLSLHALKAAASKIIDQALTGSLT